MLTIHEPKKRKRKAVQLDMIQFRGLTLDDVKSPELIEVYNEDLPLFEAVQSILDAQEKKKQNDFFGGS